ncbi:MAG: hypothetical protein WD990_06970 [Acidimicrobiia bacterium]
MKKTLTITILTLGLTVSACGAGEPGTMPSDYAPDDVVLTISEEGGFAPVEMILRRSPRYVLQADGRLYAPGAVPAIHPGPMLTPIFVGTLDDTQMQEIFDLIDGAGLPEIDGRLDENSAVNNVADATTTVITYFDGETEHTLAVYALGIALETSDRARSAADLIDAVDRANGTLTDATEYRPTKVEIRTGDRMGLPDPEFRTTEPWPLAIAPGEMPEGTHGWRCVIVEGPPATDLLEAFGAANQATVWEHEGVEYPLIARGLFPGEPGCA